MAGHASTGTLSYNGISFNAAHKVKVVAEPIQDEAQRTIVYVRHTITVEATIASGSSTDQDIESIRRALTKQGRQLVFTNEGYGDNLTVNSTNGGGIRDVKWGPVPKILTWEPIGDNKAVQVVWSVSTCIPECTDARYSGVLAQNYEVTYDIDEHGDTTRTIAGYLEIAQTWNGTSRTPPDNADSYRQNISPTAPAGFQRTQNWKLSKDKSRIDFSIVDREIATENPYPADVTAIDGKHSVKWSRGKKGSLKYVNDLRVSISMRRGISGSRAWLIFGTILNQRRAIARNLGKTTILTSLEAEEDLFGRTSLFAASYWFTSSIDKFLNESGLWVPLGTSWQLWKTSLSGDAFSNRGHAGLYNSVANDTIVDLCGSQPTALAEGTEPAHTIGETKYRVNNQKPPEGKSYLHYESEVHVDQHNKSVQQSKLQEPPSLGSDYPAGGTQDTVQVRGAPTYTYTLIGQATRAGYPVPRPAIVSIGNQRAQPIGNGLFRQKIVGNFFGVPVYAAMWNLPFAVAGPASQLPIPDHLQENVFNGQANQPT